MNSLIETDLFYPLKAYGVAPHSRRGIVGREPNPAMANNAPATVEFSTYLGSMIEYGLRLRGGEVVIAHRQNGNGASEERFTRGDAVFAQWPESASLVL